MGNFRKSYFQVSLHYENKSELPVFNLFKIHGSVAWAQKSASGKIAFSVLLNQISKISSISINPSELIPISNKSTVDELVANSQEKKTSSTGKDFIKEYEKLSIVNPTKEKFRDTVLNQTYYELLRIYSNELEKENSILVVIGFSFADEHIREITVRVANSNPTLKIYILAHSFNAMKDIQKEINKSNQNNRNIEILHPPKIGIKALTQDNYKFDLETINKRLFMNLHSILGLADNASE